MRNGCKLFLCFSSSASVVLQVLLYICEEKASPEENLLLPIHQFLLLPQRGCNVSVFPCSIPDFFLRRTGTSSPKISIANARWQCPTRLRFLNPDSEAAKTWVQSQVWALGGAPRFLAGARSCTCAPAVTRVSWSSKAPSIIS